MQDNDRGQVFIFVLLAVVGMLGFAALTVDGGRVYAERRRAQSAADTAAFAAAFAASNGKSYSAAALAQASLNGFSDDTAIAEPQQALDVAVYNPPIDGPYATLPDRSRYFQVKIRSQVSQVFSQVVYHGPLSIEVEAVSHLTPAVPLTGPNAVVASLPSGCKGVWFQGVEVTTIQGGVFANGTPESDTASDNCPSILQSGPAEIALVNGGFSTPGTFVTDRHAGKVQAAFFDNNADPLTEADLPIPGCAEDLPKRFYTGGSDPLLPGYYADGIQATGADLILKPGLYCLGGDLQIRGGSLTGNGVTLLVRQGSFQVDSSTQVSLHAPQTNGEAGPQWRGMLLYMPRKNQGAVVLGGADGSSYDGTIWAPGPPSEENASKCVLSGSGGQLAFRSSISCYSVQFNGSSSIEIVYEPARNFQLPAHVSLMD